MYIISGKGLTLWKPDFNLFFHTLFKNFAYQSNSYQPVSLLQMQWSWIIDTFDDNYQEDLIYKVFTYFQRHFVILFLYSVVNQIWLKGEANLTINMIGLCDRDINRQEQLPKPQEKKSYSIWEI